MSDLRKSGDMTISSTAIAATAVSSGNTDGIDLSYGQSNGKIICNNVEVAVSSADEASSSLALKLQQSNDNTTFYDCDDATIVTLSTAKTSGTLKGNINMRYMRMVITKTGSDAIKLTSDYVATKSEETRTTFQQDSGTITGVDVTTTDDITAGDDLVVTDDASVGGDLAVTGNQTIGGTLAVTGTTTLTGALAAKLKLYQVGTGSPAASASGLLMGVGTTANPVLSASAANFVEIRAKGTATSGDTRNHYLRLDLGGAGISGECIRAITDLTAAANTARGAHISLQPDDTGYVTGLGAGIDAQLLFGNAALAANGTYTAINSEIYSAGSSTDVSGCTALSFFRAANSGDATGMGTVDDKAVLFDLTGFTSGAAKLWYDHQGSAPANVEEWVKVKTPAGTRWLALYNAVV